MAHESDIQFLQYAATVDYPFVGPTVDANIRSFVADILVRFVQDLSGFPVYNIRAGVKIGTFTKSGSTISFTLLAADGSTVINSASATTSTSQTWGNWKIWEYRHANWSVKLVLNTDATTDFSVTGNDNYYLTARCVEFTPLFIKQFSVNSVLVNSSGVVTNPTPTLRTFLTNAKFQAGFNVKIEKDPSPEVPSVTNEVQPAAADFSNVLRFNVIPGSGEGRYSDCSEPTVTTPYIQKINGIGPDARGNLNLAGADCYRVERPIHFASAPPESNPRKGTITPGELELNGDCGSCTDCDDYYNAYVMLRRIYLKLKDTRDRSETLSRQYQHVGRLISTFNDYLMVPEVRLRFIRNQGNVFTAQLMFRTGRLAFDSFKFRIAWPTFDGTFKAINYSAWQRLHGEQTKQVDDVIRIGPSGVEPGSWLYNFTYTRLFKPHTLHWWSWAFTALPTVGTPAPTLVDPITATIDLDWNWTADPSDGGEDPADYNKDSKRRLDVIYPAPSTVDPEVTP